MPYIFGALVVANAVALGYFIFVPAKEPQSLTQAKSQLQQPLKFSNTSDKLPPPIGKK